MYVSDTLFEDIFLGLEARYFSMHLINLLTRRGEKCVNRNNSCFVLTVRWLCVRTTKDFKIEI